MTNSVIIYTDGDFKGGSQALEPGRYNINYATVGDNTISSISIPTGWKATVYADRDYKGEMREYTQNVATLGDFNDRISSIIVSDESANVGLRTGPLEGKLLDLNIEVTGTLILIPVGVR